MYKEQALPVIHILYFGIYVGNKSPRHTALLHISENYGCITFSDRNFPKYPNTFEAYELEPDDDDRNWYSKYTWDFLRVYPSKEMAEAETYEFALIIEKLEKYICSANDLLKYRKHKAFL